MVSARILDAPNGADEAELRVKVTKDFLKEVDAAAESRDIQRSDIIKVAVFDFLAGKGVETKRFAEYCKALSGK